MNVSRNTIVRIILDDNFGFGVTYHGIYTHRKSMQMESHRHDGIEVNCVLQGECAMRIGGHYATFGPKQVMVIYPGITHDFRVLSGKPCILSQFEFVPLLPETKSTGVSGDVSAFLSRMKNHQHQYDHFIDDGVIANCLRNISVEVGRNTPEDDALLKVYFSELTLLLSRKMIEVDQASFRAASPVVQKVVEAILAHLEEGSSEEELAAENGVSSRHLRALFKKYTGTTISHYTEEARISKALDMMKHRMALNRIALACGFGTQQYFSRRFRKSIGMTPSDFRRTLLRKV
jgi:AraC-like DNA-binding protein/mannose-6-phosphate isomerase-like protein (cupin superfamily)